MDLLADPEKAVTKGSDDAQGLGGFVRLNFRDILASPVKATLNPRQPSDCTHDPKLPDTTPVGTEITANIPSTVKLPKRPHNSTNDSIGNSKLACKVTEIVLLAPGKKLDCPISASSHSGFIMYSGAAAPSTPAASDLLLFTSRGLICSGPVTETVSTGDCWGMGGFMISVVKV